LPSTTLFHVSLRGHAETPHKLAIGLTEFEAPKIFTRQMFYQMVQSPEIQKFESEKGIPIRMIPMQKFLDPKQLTTGVSPLLIQTKLFDQVIKGAENVILFDRAAKVVSMDAPKKEVPLVNYTDFKVHKGLTGAKPRTAGGYYDHVELDCSQENGLYRVEIAMDKTWIRDAQWSAIEDALENAGKAMYDQVLSTIMAKYEADVDSTMTDTVANWGGSHYKALVKGVSLISSQRMRATSVFIHPDELYDLMILDYFVHSNYSERAAKGDIDWEEGLAGYLFPNKIPIYFTPSVTAAKMTIAAANKAVVLGIRQGLTIENFNDVVGGQEGGVITMQWDVKSGKDAKKTKPTLKSWAVATAA